MVFYFRLVAIIGDDFSFTNVTTEARELFRDGGAVCRVHLDNRMLHSRIVFEQGPFGTRTEAEERGRCLTRRFKLYMAEHDYPISLTGRLGGDGGKLHVHYDDISSWDSLPANCERPVPARPAYINGGIGLSIYGVEQELSELSFLEGNLNIQTAQRLTLGPGELARWDERMELSLALLTSSVALTDLRAAFILLMQSIEVLVSDFQSRDQAELDAIDAVLGALGGLELESNARTFIEQTLKGRKAMSVQQKVKALLDEYLPGVHFGGKSAAVFFSDCYSARSSFIHSGIDNKIDAERSYELKRLCLALLRAISGETQA